MELSWRYASQLYKTVIDERVDHRTQSWPLVHSPWNPIVAAVVYLYFCLNVKKITAKMPTYQIRPLLVAYNAFMVLLSCYMTYEFYGCAIMSNFNWLCQGVEYTQEYLPMRLANVCWIYYASKYAELTETVMFAMRKKYNQISFLHVYHHTSMLFVWWLNTKYCAGGQSFLFGGINSSVHAIMYTYYLMTAIGPHMQKYLWWKRYITVIQLSQFVILFFFCIQSVIRDCGYPNWMCYLMVGYATTLLVLFLNFYIHAYITKKRSQKTEPNGKAAVKNGTASHNGRATSNGVSKQD